MPLSDYMRDRIGTARIEPSGPFTAGEYTQFSLVYTAGFFGIDDSGSLKIVQRFASDLSAPQFQRPEQDGYVTVEASNGAVLRCSYDIKNNLRPWGKTIYIKIVRGYLQEGDTITVRFGDRSGGSPGIRMQTFCEDTFELKVLVDAFATYDYAEIPHSPTLQVVPGDPVSWHAVLPTVRRPGEAFRLGIRADDQWGNPSDRADAELHLDSSMPVSGLPETVAFPKGERALVLEELAVEDEGELTIRLRGPEGALLARSNPLVVRSRRTHDSFWADMHGQSEETIGTNTAGQYFSFGRDLAFLDVMCHQGNDFQITREFWGRLQELTAQFTEPGRFVAFPGYEWSANTALGGDHNVLFLRENETIHRSSHALVYDRSDADTDCHTIEDLHEALRGVEHFLYVHVGGRYAFLGRYASGSFPAGNPPRVAVEVHSAWGTSEWLLHDAFRAGLRVGVVANSDGHKGRPGASHPGASRFGSYGGYTCFLAQELTREAIFRCLTERRHYATSGARIHLDLSVSCGRRADLPMGTIAEAEASEAHLAVTAVGTAPILRIDVMNGTHRVDVVRPYQAADVGSRIRVEWEGAEYRGRGRETSWDGSITFDGAAIRSARGVNFWNPDTPPVQESDVKVSFRSLTTGGISGMDFLLDEGPGCSLTVDTPLVEERVDLESVGVEPRVFDAGGLGRRLRIYRLPEAPTPSSVTAGLTVPLEHGTDNPLYVRVVQEDGHMAWSSPVYLSR